MKRTVISIAITAVAVTALIVSITSKGSAATPQLVYICGQTPCTNTQELEVFDANGSPIYSVGEFGGDAVFGDNRSVFPPNSVFHPVIVESYTDPATYAAQHKISATCTVPERWDAPTAIYVCRNGKFVLKVQL